MNKVVTIELAGQVFWVDETGFDLLQHYLVQLKEQLAQHESSDDIFLDIQLRLAELLYQHQPNPNQCIQNDELLKIIDQIGLIEDEQPPKEPATKRSYRDPNNRIIAGVCAGIGARLGVPAFLIRLIFLPTILFFGLGIVLYGLLWLAIRPKDNRSSNLEASGITPTAASIAQYEQPKPSPLLTLQRILFLPFSLVGLILLGTGSHLSKRRSFYFKLGKNVIALPLLILTLGLGALITELYVNNLFGTFFSLILVASVVYLVFVFWALFLRSFYLANPTFSLPNGILWGSAVPVFVIIGSIWHFVLENYYQYHETSETVVELAGNQLSVTLDDPQYGRQSYPVRYQFKVDPLLEGEVLVKNTYYSDGRDAETAQENLRKIQFQPSYTDQQLNLPTHWHLQPGNLQRGQHLEVEIHLPSNIQLVSNLKLGVNSDGEPYYFQFDRNAHFNQPQTSKHAYLAYEDMLHEYDSTNRDRLGSNERVVLGDKFCKAYFIAENWRCSYILRTPVSENQLFDRAHESSLQDIEQFRQWLQPDRSIFVSTLETMEEYLGGIQAPNNEPTELQVYIRHLIALKSSLS